MSKLITSALFATTILIGGLQIGAANAQPVDRTTQGQGYSIDREAVKDLCKQLQRSCY